MKNHDKAKILREEKECEREREREREREKAYERLRSILKLKLND